MYGMFSLLIIAFGGAAAMLILLNYVPLKSSIFKMQWSPRLILCKFLAPIDAAVTTILVCGAWVGITTVTGIGSMVYNVLTGLGLSAGAIFVRKVLRPKWEMEYRRWIS